MLSKAGKEILIKAVVQAIPTYTMSYFKLPDSLCEELMSMMGPFGLNLLLLKLKTEN